MEKNGQRYYTSRMCTDKKNCGKSKTSITEKGTVKTSSCCTTDKCNELKNLTTIKQRAFVQKNQNIHELSINNFTDQVLGAKTSWLVLLQVKRCVSKLFDTV